MWYGHDFLGVLGESRYARLCSTTTKRRNVSFDTYHDQQIGNITYSEEFGQCVRLRQHGSLNKESMTKEFHLPMARNFQSLRCMTCPCAVRHKRIHLRVVLFSCPRFMRHELPGGGIVQPQWGPARKLHSECDPIKGSLKRWGVRGFSGRAKGSKKL